MRSSANSNLDSHAKPARTAGNHRLARNTLWNLLGQGLPLLFALFAIPYLISGLGTSRFGVLALAWMVIGYFSLFDLGLGRALTKIVAEKLGSEQEAQVPHAVWTALALMLGFGIVGALVALFSSPWLVHSVLKVPEVLESETLNAFYILSATIPSVIVTSGLRGVLEAYQRFGAINLIRSVLGALNFIGPLLVLPFSTSLLPIVAFLSISRGLACLIHLGLCLRAVPVMRRKISLSKKLLRPLLSLGGWMTVSNVVGPLMVYLDRFLIGAILSMAAVAYYVTPYEVVTKLWLIPGALAGVLFPAFAATLETERQHAAQLFRRGVKAIFVSMFPLCLVIVAFAEEGLDLWLGSEFAKNSTPVMQWLTVGVLINSLAQMPFALVQGAGRADVTAKLHLAELPLYLFALWVLLETFGITGAAIAWVLRVAVDTVILFAIARRIVPETVPKVWPATIVGVSGILVMTVATAVSGTWPKLLYVILLSALFLGAAWHVGLSVAERDVLIGMVKTGFAGERKL
jgi:O-antigen/teichoic acid export membrane protein